MKIELLFNTNKVTPEKNASCLCARLHVVLVLLVLSTPAPSHPHHVCVTPACH